VFSIAGGFCIFQISKEISCLGAMFFSFQKREKEAFFSAKEAHPNSLSQISRSAAAL